MTSNFQALDWAIVGVYLLGTVIIGLYANRYIRDMADYIVAGRSLKSYISIATMLGSEIGLVTVMYTAQKGFSAGFSAFHIGLAGGLTCLFVGLTGFVVVRLRETGVMTIPEFYGRRYGKGVRILGGTILAVAGVLNMGVFLKAGAIFVTSLTGLQDPAAVDIVMVVLITLVLIYTILGGMVSVVITDYIQFVVLAFGMLAASGLALYHQPWDQVVAAVWEVHGEAGFNPLADGSFGLSYVLWMIFVFGIGSCAVWPTAVMRACAAKDIHVVRRLYTWSSIGFMTRFIIPQLLGICAMAYFWHTMGAGSQFFTAEGKVVPDETIRLQAMPLFLSQILPTGVIGLIGAGMLAAFMSTHDSYLLCWCSVMIEDVVNPLCGGTLAVRTRLLLTRIAIFLTGVFLLVWSLWYQMGQDMLEYLAVCGSIYLTGAFALLVFGLYWKRSSRVGAYLALIAGASSVVGLTPVKTALGLTPERLGFTLTEAQVALFALSSAILMMVVGSLFFPDSQTPTTQEVN
ncbi:MAG: sodium:solute symporter family protein [Planctomycetales bacterium]|nr:sodium:solute symporter family protein [Planctomycetales bacterium]